MNELELKVLKALEKNARIDLHDLALMLSISDVDLANIITSLEERKIICGYHTLINWNNVTKENINAVIEVKVSPQRGLGFDKIAQRIYQFPEVDSIYLMSGGFDFMVMIEGKSMGEVSRFVFEKLSVLESVLSTATHFVLKTYKDHGIVMDEEKIDPRQQDTL